MAPTSCDFEKDGLCWWEQDPKHDFDWTRHRFDTPSSHIGTGPTHDHTLGSGYDGKKKKMFYERFSFSHAVLYFRVLHVHRVIGEIDQRYGSAFVTAVQC